MLHTDCNERFKREREMFYLTTHSTHFIYGYMASDIWLWTILIVRTETRCRHIGYSYRLTARVLLYAPSNRQDNTYHGLCYTSRGALAGTRNSSIERFKDMMLKSHENMLILIRGELCGLYQSNMSISIKLIDECSITQVYYEHIF